MVAAEEPPLSLGAPQDTSATVGLVPVLRVLAVEDDAADAVLVREMLRDCASGRFEFEHAPALKTAIECLAAGGVDCVLLDLSLPDARGLEALARIHEVAAEIPIVVFSARTDEDVAVRAVQEGAQDYLIKGQVDERLLARALQYAIERKRAEVALAHQALHDALTGLPNRVLLFDRLGQALSRAQRGGTPVAVLFCDIDRFKLVNDSLGHGAGDQLLIGVARRLVEILRGGDTAARFGGDEFVVLCEDVGGERQAIAVAQRIALALEAPFLLDGHQVFARISTGIAVAEGGAAAPEALIRNADVAMSRVKERGTGGYEVFDDDMRARAVRRLDVENALHRAVARGEFTLLYQPQVRLATGEMTGVEALVRWEHPERGLVVPADFIPLAEETGLVLQIGAWVLNAACRQAAEWAARPGGPPLTMSVNLSARQCAPDVVATMAEVLGRTGVDPGLVRLELTETAVMEDAESSAAALELLKALGVQLAIDDFGTGYSSLRALRRFPVDELKIDASFVSGMQHDEQEGAIVAAVVGLARALGLRTVAEGVEHPEQVRRLRELGCDLAQGFHFAPAQPASAFS